MRGLIGIGGAVLAWQAWPVAKGAWQAQKADAIVTQLRQGWPLDKPDVPAAMAALDRAVEADPVAGRLLQRSELLAGIALTPGVEATPEQRNAWLRQARADLDAGLADAPARGVAWARLAAVRQALNGPSTAVVPPLLMSIDTAPMMSPVWPARLQLILDNWASFTPEQRERVGAYVVQTWRRSPDRRWFALAVRSPIDELFVRYFLRDEPDAQEEITRRLAAEKKR